MAAVSCLTTCDDICFAFYRRQKVEEERKTTGLDMSGSVLVYKVADGGWAPNHQSGHSPKLKLATQK